MADDLSRRRHEHAAGEHTQIERRLRAALEARANEATPGHRLDLILEQAGARGGSARSGRSPWTLALVAAAVVAALAIALSGILGGPPGAGPLTPGAPDSPTVAQDGTASEGPTDPGATDPTDPTDPTDTGSPEPTATEPGAGETTETPGEETPEIPPTTHPTLAALPVYYPAHIGDDLRMIRLYREWLNVDGVERSAPLEVRLEAALDAAMHANPPHTDGYLSFWHDVQVDAVQATEDGIRIVLDAPGTGANDAEEARLAVQQLVWTAQAVVGQGNLPVRFEVADGSDTLQGHLPVSQSYRRPASPDLYYEDLAPIWVTSPTRYANLDGPDVTVTGEATVFEATVQWELIDGTTGSVIDSGFTTASAGAPARGTYEIPLTGLDDGLYRIRVFELSMADGERVNAETSIPFFIGPGEPPTMD